MKTRALAIYTVRHTLRSKSMLAGLAVSLLYLAAIPLLSTAGGGGAMTGAGNRNVAGVQFLNFALGGLNLIGMFMAVFVSLGSVHDAIERGTMAALVTKPMRRSQVVLGRWAGYALLMIGYVLIIGLSLWLTVALDTGQPFWSYLPALGLACLNVVTMVTLTYAISVFMPAAANAIFAFLIFGVTASLSLLNIAGAGDGIGMRIVGNLFRLSLPVGEVGDQMRRFLRFKPRTAPIAPAYLVPRGWSFLYEIVYVGALLLLVVTVFGSKDLD